MLKLLSLFTGIGAFEKALKNLKINYELVGFSEIDKFAIKSYCAIHNVSETKNLGDISKINIKNIPDFDIMTWGFPCQDISSAGKMKGIKEGTRSGLYYEGYKILKEKRPKYSIIENVKNLTSKRFKTQFESILKNIQKLGYTNYWQILNAKDFGIPQNRKRVFIVSIRNDVDNHKYTFPSPVKLKLKLKDFLEKNVDSKFYLSEKAKGKIIKINNYKQSCIFVREGINQKYVEAIDGDSINISYPNNILKRGRVGKGIVNTLLTRSNIAVVIKENTLKNNKPTLKIRKLTPLEHWRLMGFNDKDFYKAQNLGISNTQLYKQAGNSIVVNILEKIFIRLLL